MLTVRKLFISPHFQDSGQQCIKTKDWAAWGSKPIIIRTLRMARLEMVGLDIEGGVCLTAACLKETERQQRANTYWVGVCVCVCVSHSVVTPSTEAHWAPLSMGFPRQEYWSGLPFPSPLG